MLTAVVSHLNSVQEVADHTAPGGVAHTTAAPEPIIEEEDRSYAAPTAVAPRREDPLPVNAPVPTAHEQLPKPTVQPEDRSSEVPVVAVAERNPPLKEETVAHEADAPHPALPVSTQRTELDEPAAAIEKLPAHHEELLATPERSTEALKPIHVPEDSPATGAGLEESYTTPQKEVFPTQRSGEMTPLSKLQQEHEMFDGGVVSCLLPPCQPLESCQMLCCLS